MLPELYSKRIIDAPKTTRRFILPYLVGAFFIIFLAIPHIASAAIRNWDGGGGDNNWSTCANWSADTCPLSTDDALFDATSTKSATIDANTVINALTINSGYSGTITAGASTLTLNGAFVQNAGTFNLSSATTTFRNGFTYSAGTLNHSSGAVVFSNGAGVSMTVTPNAAVFNNVVMEYATTSGVNVVTSLGSDMTINGNLTALNSNPGGGGLTIRSSVSGTPRALTVGGNLNLASTTQTTLTNMGNTADTFRIVVNLFGNILISDGEAALYADINFASSSVQTITKTAGTINSISDWLDGGSGNFALGSNVSGSMVLNVDDVTDFTLNSSAFTFTVGNATITPGITYTPSGASSTIFTTLTLGAGTFTANASTSIGSLTINGGTFNGGASATTTITSAFTYTSGTFNHNSGTMAFINPAASSITITPNSAVLNNVFFDYPTTSGANTTTLIASDMTVAGNFALHNTNTNGGGLAIQSNIPGTSRAISIGGNLLFASTTAQNGNQHIGVSTGLSNIAIDLKGSLIMFDANSTLYADIAFSSSSNQTISKVAGNINAVSDWTDTGSGNLSLTSNFSGSMRLVTDSTDDFNFAASAFTFTVGDLLVSTSTSFTPAGPSSYVITNAGLYTGTLNASASTSIATLTINGGTFNAAAFGTTTITSAFTYTSGTFNHNSGVMAFINGSAANATITPNAAVFNNVFFDYPVATGVDARVFLASDMTVAGNFVMQNTNSGGGQYFFQSSVSGSPRNLAIGGSLIFSSTTQTSTANLGISGGLSNIVVDLKGNYIMSDSSAFLYGDITLSSSSTQTIARTFGSVTIYSDWTINKSGGQALMTTAFTIGGSLTIATGTLRTAGFNLVATSTAVSAAGTLQIQGSETTIASTTFATSSTMVYDGVSGPYTLKNLAYKNLTISGSGATFILPAAISVAQDLNITAGTLDASTSNFALNVGGDWINSGTYTPRNGTVTLNGANQHIYGTTTFYNLTKNVTTADTLRFTASSTQTISNTWTASGTSGNLLSLRSTSNGTRWNINPQGTRTLGYLNVQDSNNANASVITVDNSITDGGNNFNWGFDAIAPSATSIVATPATTTASIVWNTDEAATSTAIYGLTAAYGSSSVSLGSTSHSVSLSNLTANTLYHYAIVSRDASGNQATTSDATFSTLDNIPPIIALTGTSTTNTSITVNWTTNEAASSSVSYGLTTSYGSASTSAGTTSHSVIVSGLTPLTVYHFRINATDASGNLATSSDIAITTLVTPDTTAPTALNIVTVVSSTTATTTWDTNEPAYSHMVYGLTSAYGLSSTPTVSTSSSHSVSLTGLSASTTYHFALINRDAAGNISTTSDATFVTEESDAPVLSNGSPSGTLPSGTTQSTLSLNTNEGATCKYDMTAGLSYAALANTFATTGGMTHSSIVTGLTDSSQYEYYAKCRDALGNENSGDLIISFAIESTPIVNAAQPQQPAPGALSYTFVSIQTPFALQNLARPEPEVVDPKDNVINLPMAPFNADLQAGNMKNDVRNLQQALNKLGFKVAANGAGSPGKETIQFGPATKQALIRFQKANGIKPAIGFFGPLTRAKLNQLLAK